jgi:tRNA threonylcarbamoyladenosine biosynthesis protein TsaB
MRTDAISQRGLAVETSGRVGSVAAVRDGVVVDERAFPHELAHAAGLVQLMADVVSGQGWKPGDLQCLYVSAGPGSFTGLRIGITAVKTLAMVTGATIVPVPTPHVLAMNAPADARHVVVVLDAKRDQIFTARYERMDAKWIERDGPRLDLLASVLAAAPRPVHLIGEGIPFHEKFLPADTSGIVITTRDSWRARAAAVAELGVERERLGLFVAPDSLVPVYVRKPEAEEKWDEMRK